MPNRDVKSLLASADAALLAGDGESATRLARDAQRLQPSSGNAGLRRRLRRELSTNPGFMFLRRRELRRELSTSLSFVYLRRRELRRELSTNQLSGVLLRRELSTN